MALGTGQVITGTSAPAGAPVVDMDALDIAVAKVPRLFAYLSAKKITAPNAGFLDRMTNSVSVPTAGAIRMAADADFNGRPSIDLASQLGNNPAYIVDPGPLSNSFTFIAAIRMATITKNPNGIFAIAGVKAPVMYLNAGTLRIYQDFNSGSVEYSATGHGIDAGETHIVWWSYDDATKTSRWGIDSATPFATYVHTKTFALDPSSRFRPFGFPTNAFATPNLEGKWGFCAIYDGSKHADAAFAALIAQAVDWYAIAP